MTVRSVDTDHSGPRVDARAFLAALAVAVVLDAALRGWIVARRPTGSDSGGPLAGVLLNGSLIVQVVVSVAFAAVLAATVPRLMQGTLPGRGRQRLLGGLASSTLLIDLAAVNLSIVRRDAGSYELLAESFALYLSTNLVFVFWYWHVDHPLRDAVAAGAAVGPGEGIRFPEEEPDGTAAPAQWLPGLVDYAYFTVASSNCFGPPEGHVLVGHRLKVLQTVHTVFMFFIFIIIVARAINTLS